MKYNKKETVKRYILLCIGLYIMTFAVRLTVVTNCGTSPLSTLPNVISFFDTGLSFGVLTSIWNGILILSQVLILRKKFELIQLLQIPLSVVFTVFLDFNEYILSAFVPTSVIAKVCTLIVGVILLSLSISLTVETNVVLNSGEAIVKAISDEFCLNFGYVKVALDVFYVVVGVAISLTAFKELRGVGLGTIFLAVFTGFIVNFFVRYLHKPIHKWLKK